MNPLSDDDLVALLEDLESDRVERKRAWSGSAPDKVREAVCAFVYDQPFDIHHEHHAAPSALSRTILEEEFLSGVFAADVLVANQRSYEG